MTPIKMSQFPVYPGQLPTGSYFVAVVPNGSGSFDNYRVDPQYLYQIVEDHILTNRWKSDPADSFAPGVDGDEAKDSNYYYLNVNGVWQRIPFSGIF